MRDGRANEWRGGRKRALTAEAARAYGSFTRPNLARWAKRLSWQEVARVFGTTWEHVFRSVKYAVSWGLRRRELEGIEAIGVDEIQWQRGHKYLTLVYQIDEDCRRLLWPSGWSATVTNRC